MNLLTAFGLSAVILMLVCYMLERRSPWWTLGFAAACWLGSAYGFLQGAWPFGMVEAIWGIVAVARWASFGRKDEADTPSHSDHGRSAAVGGLKSASEDVHAGGCRERSRGGRS